MLPDFLGPDLKVVFCGTAAGRRSGELGHYYAGRGNAFWSALHQVGLTPRLLSPEEDALLPSYGIGLTDLAKGVSGMDRNIPKESFRPDAVRGLGANYRPAALAFNGKGAARAVLGKSVPDYGAYSVPGLPPVWVLPSTSGAARWCFSVDPWQALAASVGSSSVP